MPWRESSNGPDVRVYQVKRRQFSLKRARGRGASRLSRSALVQGPMGKATLPDSTASAGMLQPGSGPPPYLTAVARHLFSSAPPPDPCPRWVSAPECRSLWLPSVDPGRLAGHFRTWSGPEGMDAAGRLMGFRRTARASQPVVAEQSTCRVAAAPGWQTWPHGPGIEAGSPSCANRYGEDAVFNRGSAGAAQARSPRDLRVERTDCRQKRLASRARAIRSDRGARGRGAGATNGVSVALFRKVSFDPGGLPLPPNAAVGRPRTTSTRRGATVEPRLRPGAPWTWSSGTLIEIGFHGPVATTCGNVPPVYEVDGCRFLTGTTVPSTARRLPEKAVEDLARRPSPDEWVMRTARLGS